MDGRWGPRTLKMNIQSQSLYEMLPMERSEARAQTQVCLTPVPVIVPFSCLSLKVLKSFGGRREPQQVQAQNSGYVSHHCVVHTLPGALDPCGVRCRLFHT